MDDEIHRFLTFMETYGSEPMAYRDGVMLTPGCEGAPGGCCSKVYDLTGLVDVLHALVGTDNHG